MDEQQLRSLCEESKDLQSDALRTSKEALDEFVEVSREHPQPDDPTSVAERVDHHRSTGRFATGALIAGGFTAAVATLLDSASASAATSSDVAILQTAASLEVLAVATYKKALTLPFIGGSSANPTIKAFAQETMAQHMDHLQAFNAAAKGLGGKAQNNPDPKYAPIVTKAVPTLKTPGDVVSLALTLETVASETYVNNCSLLSSEAARKVTASIMGIEAQHVAVLSAAGALIKAGAPQLITLSPTNVVKLPMVAGSVGIPYSFWPTTMASPATEGAVK